MKVATTMGLGIPMTLAAAAPGAAAGGAANSDGQTQHSWS